MFKPKFYIVYPNRIIDEITWAENAPYRCGANFPGMFESVLKLPDNSIGSEIKLIWNNEHRNTIIQKNDVEYDDVENYLKADCSILSFEEQNIRDMVSMQLDILGGKDFVCVDSYRDVILKQAFYRLNKTFEEPSEKRTFEHLAGKYLKMSPGFYIRIKEIKTVLVGHIPVLYIEGISYLVSHNSFNVNYNYSARRELGFDFEAYLSTREELQSIIPEY